MSDEETRRSIELEKYFAVLPAFRGVYKRIDYQYADTVSSVVDDPYNSARQTTLCAADIITLLDGYGLCDLPDVNSQWTRSTRYWPGDKEDQAAKGTEK